MQGTRLVVCAVFGEPSSCYHVIGIAMVGNYNERIAVGHARFYHGFGTGIRSHRQL